MRIHLLRPILIASIVLINLGIGANAQSINTIAGNGTQGVKF